MVIKYTKTITAITLLFILTNSTACSKDWFGNEESSAPDNCTISGMNQEPVPKEIPTPIATIEILVRAVRYMSDGTCNNSWAVPVSLGVYATAEGFDAIKMPDGRPLPWNAERISPWSAVFYLTTSSGKPPPKTSNIKIDFSAKHLADHPGNDNVSDRVALGCLIRVNGGTIASDIVSQMKPGQLVRCKADFVL